MGAETAGRKLGIGLRLAAKAARLRIAENETAPTPAPSGPPQQPIPRASYKYQGTLAQAVSTASQAAAKAPTFAQGIGQGAKRFGEAVWGPMAHTGSVLSLEITGLFFGLFTLFFGQNVYKMRHDYVNGPEHKHLLVYSVCTLIFAWFTFSNFYQARKKEKKNRARGAARRT